MIEVGGKTKSVMVMVCREKVRDDVVTPHSLFPNEGLFHIGLEGTYCLYMPVFRHVLPSLFCRVWDRKHSSILVVYKYITQKLK